MSRNDPRSVIRLQGVRQNNLKNFDLDLPTRKLVVITGLSGSGKSSLAFDTLFAEGQRRYIETFSPYARQFFDRMDKPKVDRIEGIPPAIAIEQKNSVRTTRSTVGTMTEICDYLKLVWPQVARVYCRGCGQPVRKEPPSLIYDEVTALPKADSGAEWLVTFELPLSDKLPLAESLDLVAKQGYQRLLWKGEPLRIEEAEPKLRIAKPASLTVIQDRLRPQLGRPIPFCRGV
jgi:excinuclease ABC subunit A